MRPERDGSAGRLGRRGAPRTAEGCIPRVGDIANVAATIQEIRCREEIEGGY
jgi:hypothetical protein